MYERDIDPHEELTDDYCNFLEAHPWHCETRSSESVDPLDDDDGLGDDVPSVRHTPYCPMDTLDALESCGRLVDDLANGKPVSRAKAVMAAVLSAETFWTFVREFSPLSPFISQNSSSTLSVLSGVAV